MIWAAGGSVSSMTPHTQNRRSGRSFDVLER